MDGAAQAYGMYVEPLEDYFNVIQVIDDGMCGIGLTSQAEALFFSLS